MISRLGDDLLAEVLIRVPEARSACRCKLICKQWNSLISDPYFLRRFDSRRNGELDSETQLMPVDSILSFLLVPNGIRRCLRVFDSFKDLLLCGIEHYSKNHELTRSYLVCNPSTKQWVSLPVAPKKPKGCRQEVRLVCETLDHDQPFVHSSDYRFRVVSIYPHRSSIKLDVFCSDSGTWTKEALVLEGCGKLSYYIVCSCKGELFCSYARIQDVGAGGRSKPLLVAFNPFRLDIPPVFIHAPLTLLPGVSRWDLSVSQGVLHMVAFERSPRFGLPTISNIWRLEEDRKSWSRQQEGLLKTPLFEGSHRYVCHECHQDPKKPEIIFLHFNRIGPRTHNSGRALVSCNLKSREVESFYYASQSAPRWAVFQSKVSGWPTPIPRYKELRGIYNGSYNWLFQTSKQATTTSLPDVETRSK